MGVLKCKWADNCFGCPYGWCKKYCSGPKNNLHLGGADMIIVTFPDGDYGYYKENDLPELAKKLDTTEAEILKHANTDGWLENTLLIWTKDKPDLITGVKAFWPNGRSMTFENTTKAAKYFDTSLQTITEKAKQRRIYKGALLLKSDKVPSEDEVVVLRYNVPPVGDIPAPTVQEQEAIVRINEIHTDKTNSNSQFGRSGNPIGALCTWETGEQVRFYTLGLMENTLRISSAVFNRHAISGELYRGVTFTRLERYYEAEETRAGLAE